jgi:FAD/FMN-containing dehydrogenase
LNEREQLNLVERLVALCGADCIVTDESERCFYAQDLFTQGTMPIAVVRLATPEMLADLVKLAGANGISLYPRGGGMSYSEAFQPQHARSLIIDFSALNHIREIAVEDGHVTVEAGCTWAVLDSALAQYNMRSRFWGPMSGLTATIGGSLSQGSVTFGSGTTGASANAVKSFEIVTGAGEIMHTGSDGSRGVSAFNRNFGPDLTGIYANDAGALGFKTAVTLEIEPRPAHIGGLSFAFDDFPTMTKLFRDVAHRRLASELIAMDGVVARQNTGAANLAQDIKAIWRIAKAAGNSLSALNRIARVALAGRRFIDQAAYTAHFVIEARDTDDLVSKMKAVRCFAKAHKGMEIVNTVPLMTRANPFPVLPVTHPDGRRMLPIHGIFAYSSVSSFHADYLALKQSFAARLADSQVEVAEFFAGVSGVGLLYEPVFYWPDTLSGYHRRLQPSYLYGIAKDYPQNDAGRALVEEITTAIIALMQTHGATHFQIGRRYPYATNREGAASDLLRGLKALLDPHGIINPGALGL